MVEAAIKQGNIYVETIREEITFVGLVPRFFGKLALDA
jgi:hypothetical protein